MGKKVNPKVMRLGVIRTWPSLWFERGDKYIKSVRQDVLIRKHLIKTFMEAGVDRVEITRNPGKISIDLWTAKPGIIIGRGGDGVEKLKTNLHRKFLTNFRREEINLNIKELERPQLSAQIAVQIAILDIEKRVPFRKVMRQIINRAEKGGALGVKIVVAGRLNGAEIARSEKLVSGKVPLQTLRADIDYARGAARTSYGMIGIKVWIYKGEVFEKDKEAKGEIISSNK